jgi:hypothetical protein
MGGPFGGRLFFVLGKEGLFLKKEAKTFAPLSRTCRKLRDSVAKVF